MTAKSIKTTLNAHLDKAIKEKEITTALEGLRSKYADDKYPFEIVEISGGFQFMTKGTFYPLVSQFLRIESKKKLSKAALETLAIISYKQPITKSVMESIRGVSCDYSVQKLLEKELIEISGRAEGPGRPLLYATSDKFMNHFGLKDLNDLPKIKEFEMPGTEIGVKDTDAVPGPQVNEGESEPTVDTAEQTEDSIVVQDNLETEAPQDDLTSESLVTSDTAEAEQESEVQEENEIVEELTVDIDQADSSAEETVTLISDEEE